MKIAVSFANIFMAEIEKKLIQQSETKPKEWIRYINNVFSLRDCERQEVNRFIKRANYFHPTIKFTAEVSENQPNHFSRYHGVQRGNICKKQKIPSGTSKLIRGRPRLSKLCTSPRATHQA